MYFKDYEIYGSYRRARNKSEQIEILAQLNNVSKDRIREIIQQMREKERVERANYINSCRRVEFFIEKQAEEVKAEKIPALLAKGAKLLKPVKKKSRKKKGLDYQSNGYLFVRESGQVKNEDFHYKTKGTIKEEYKEA